MKTCNVYLRSAYEAECELAFYASRLLKKGVDAITPLTDGLLHKQPQSVVNACTKPLSILTGPPGTGKTTTLKMIVKSFEEAGLSGAVVAPFGKAAKRADEVINSGKSATDHRVTCSTIHKMLAYEPVSGKFSFNRTNRLDLDFLIMDEFSTCDLYIMRDVLEAIEPGRTRVILTGDQYQLPSVDIGAVARDMILSNVIPMTELDVVLRTGANSGIAYNASRILHGQETKKIDPQTGDQFNDFFLVPRESEQKTLETIIDWVTDSIPKKRGFDPLTEIQLLSPGKNGTIGVDNLNRVFRDLLNKESKNSKKAFGFRTGDKVLNIKNKRDLNIVNGDVGFVVDVSSGNSGSHLLVDFGRPSGPLHDGHVEISSDNAEHLTLAYATTVHKFQGSECKAVITPVHPIHTRLLVRTLVYTALTRARELGTFVGDLSKFSNAVRNTYHVDRVTRLQKLLKSASSKTVN